MANYKILVVDDEKPISDIIKFNLTKEGYDVVVAMDGQEALDLFESEEPDLVLLDQMLPELEGTEVLRQIRTKSQTPVIMVTAKDSEIDKVLGLEMGADDYVTKPFSPGEMMARVKVQLRKGMKIEKKAERILEADGLRMDTESCQVTVDGREVVLAGKEFWLLKFFMEHPGQVFTKAQIYHHVWEDGYEDDNTVMVYISKLREKLEDKPNERIWIQTIRGIGYRFGGSR